MDASCYTLEQKIDDINRLIDLVEDLRSIIQEDVFVSKGIRPRSIIQRSLAQNLSIPKVFLCQLYSWTQGGRWTSLDGEIRDTHVVIWGKIVNKLTEITTGPPPEITGIEKPADVYRWIDKYGIPLIRPRLRRLGITSTHFFDKLTRLDTVGMKREMASVLGKPTTTRRFVNMTRPPYHRQLGVPNGNEDHFYINIKNCSNVTVGDCNVTTSRQAPPGIEILEKQVVDEANNTGMIINIQNCDNLHIGDTFGAAAPPTNHVLLRSFTVNNMSNEVLGELLNANPGGYEEIKKVAESYPGPITNMRSFLTALAFDENLKSSPPNMSTTLYDSLLKVGHNPADIHTIMSKWPAPVATLDDFFRAARSYFVNGSSELKLREEGKREETCVICLENMAKIGITNCEHTTFCKDCIYGEQPLISFNANGLSRYEEYKCPLCRVVGALKVKLPLTG